MKDRSAVLRNTQTTNGGGKSTYNKEAKSLEYNVLDSVLSVLNVLKSEYPDYEFCHIKSHDKDMFMKAAGVDCYKPEADKSAVRPDGGSIFIKIKDELIPILTVEAKKQGTNTTRLEEGLKKQAKGNAIERAFKNFEEFRILYEKYDWFNYVLFAQGCDFEKGSSILDRLDAMTRYLPRNNCYTFHPKQLASVFIKPEGFDEEYIYNILYDTTKSVLNRIQECDKRQKL